MLNEDFSAGVTSQDKILDSAQYEMPLQQNTVMCCQRLLLRYDTYSDVTMQMACLVIKGQMTDTLSGMENKQRMPNPPFAPYTNAR
jgi:hypothetical protein